MSSMGVVIENLQGAALCQRWYCASALSDAHSQPQGSAEQPPLRLEILDDGNGRLRAILVGEIDFANASSLQAEIAAVCVERNAYALILDMTGVEFMDSSGLRTMLQLQHELTQAHGGLVLLSPTPQVRSILTLTGLDRRLLVAATLELAQASLAGESAASGDATG
ncbi:MAG TPA: STAS domain-containing protein [Solirubrobacteraceae bacterium]